MGSLVMALAAAALLAAGCGAQGRRQRIEKGSPMGEHVIDGKRVSKKEFDAFLKTLKEVDKTWYCAETSAGGITGYDARDGSGAVYSVRLESGGGASEIARKAAGEAPAKRDGAPDFRWEERIRFDGPADTRDAAIGLVDRSVRRHGRLGALGDLTAGLGALSADNELAIADRGPALEVVLSPKSGRGHDLSFKVDKATLAISDVVAGEVLPPPEER